MRLFLRAVWSGSTLFVILSATFGCITHIEHFSNFRITAIFRLSEFFRILEFYFIIWAISWDMVLFVLRKLILQTCMCSYPVGIDVWFLARPFVCFICANSSPEPLLVAYVISTIISWAGSFYDLYDIKHTYTNGTSSALLYLYFLLFKSSKNWRTNEIKLSLKLSSCAADKFPRKQAYDTS